MPKPPAPLGGPPGPLPLTTGPATGQMSHLEPGREPFAAPSPCPAPPMPTERALAALGRGRAALVTRHAQLAACRACGAEAAAYQQAAADLETLASWVASLLD